MNEREFKHTLYFNINELAPWWLSYYLGFGLLFFKLYKCSLVVKFVFRT